MKSKVECKVKLQNLRQSKVEVKKSQSFMLKVKFQSHKKSKKFTFHFVFELDFYFEQLKE